jgi:hypothetical protein
VSAGAERKSARHRHTTGMADAEQPRGHPQRCGGLCRAAGKMYGRCRASRPVNHDVGECDTRTKSRAERLEDCLLGGKPSGQAFDPIGCSTDLLEFSLNETAWYQRITRVLDPAPQFGDLNHIDSMSDDIHAG